MKLKFEVTNFVDEIISTTTNKILMDCQINNEGITLT